MPDLSPWSWTLPQRRALIALIALATAALAIKAYLWPVYIPAAPPAVGIRASDLADNLDPNTAPAAALSTLPELGRARAQAIVVYRENFLAAHPDQLAFSRPEDLTNIKGIGPATVEKLRPFLVFDTAPSEDSR